jgi:hypothetical protein
MTSRMNAHIIGAACAVLLLFATGCSTLTPRGSLRSEFVEIAEFVVEQDGMAIFGGVPPTLEELRSGQKPEKIHRLVANLEGENSVSARMLLSALAALEGRRLAMDFYKAFDQVSERLAVDDLNLVLMKALRVRAVTIPFPESGYTVLYTLRLGDTGYGYSNEVSGDA